MKLSELYLMISNLLFYHTLVWPVSLLKDFGERKRECCFFFDHVIFLHIFRNRKRHALKFGEDLSNFQPVNFDLSKKGLKSQKKNITPET